VAPVPDADNVGVDGVPRLKEALPARIAISSLSIIFCKRRNAIVAWTSSKVRPAEMAPKVAASSSPMVTKVEVLVEVEYDIWPERWPSGTHPIASKPEPIIALIWRQFVAEPTPPPTRGMMFLSGVTNG
jgi:hypothetical protein